MTTPTETQPRLRKQGGLEVLAWPQLDAFDLDAVVTTRRGGVSSGSYESLNLGLHVGDKPTDVLENRRRVSAALEADPADFVFCNQAHGREVRIVSPVDRGRGALRQEGAIDGTDALVTRDPGIVLVVMVADCMPIVLYDPAAHVLACVHAGWRGTVARVSEAAVQVMQSMGAQPRNITAALGPAIAPDRYQVGADVVAAAERCFGGNTSGIIRADATGKWLFDLWAANWRILRESGIPDDQVSVAALPTGKDTGLFFSDREERPCGRFAAVARLRSRGAA